MSRWEVFNPSMVAWWWNRRPFFRSVRVLLMDKVVYFDYWRGWAGIPSPYQHWCTNYLYRLSRVKKNKFESTRVIQRVRPVFSFTLSIQNQNCNEILTIFKYVNKLYAWLRRGVYLHYQIFNLSLVFVYYCVGGEEVRHRPSTRPLSSKVCNLWCYLPLIHIFRPVTSKNEFYGP